ncbi:MAG: hypothetical protein ACE3L7_06630 [Candidatus Pristimantibacillus sp.]
MRSKRNFLIVVILVLIGIIAYWNYEVNPKEFPNEEFLITNMNGYHPKDKIVKILDTIELDNRHVFVPYLSTNEHYGVSYWIKEKFGWKMAKMDTRGEPHIWKLKAKDPSTYYIVWNIDPKDQVSYLDYYLISERNASLSMEKSLYTPRIQKQMTISMKESPYGILRMPEEWSNIYRNVISNNNLYMGWIPYDKQDKVVFPKLSVNGSGYLRSNIELDFMRILNEMDLEMP